MARVIIPYKPRPQFVALHKSAAREKVVVAHRRFGKTVGCLNEAIKGALTCTLSEPRFAYVAPYHAQAKDVAWAYLKHFSAPVPGVQFHESELRVDFPNGGRVRLYGAENAERLRGLYLDGVVVDEYADFDPRVWPEIIAPTLADRKGWVIKIGTPKGRNQFALDYEAAVADPERFALMLRASETGVLDPDELERMRGLMTPEQYDQEFECSFTAAIRGAYYGKELADALADGRITSLPYLPEHGVETWWDLGVSDSTAIWFVQRVGDWLHVIDYYEANNEGLGHYAKVIHGKPYVYTRHIAPHDIEARDWSQMTETAKSRKEVAAALGIRFEVTPQHGVADGINAVRMKLGRCRFDAAKTERGLEALRQYRVAWNDKMQVAKDHPLHDWTSHGADAFRTGIMGPTPPSQQGWAPITYARRTFA